MLDPSLEGAKLEFEAQCVSNVLHNCLTQSCERSQTLFLRPALDPEAAKCVKNLHNPLECTCNGKIVQEG